MVKLLWAASQRADLSEEDKKENRGERGSRSSSSSCYKGEADISLDQLDNHKKEGGPRGKEKERG